MASKEVVDAVNLAVAPWTRAPFVGPNLKSETPADGSEYVLIDYPVADSGQLTFGAPGANVWREEGVFRLIIHAVRGAGVNDGLIWAGELAALFRGKDFGNGFQTFAPAPPVTDDDSENGNYYLLAVAVPYQFDLIG